MSLQVLVAAMDQKDHSLLDKMNIQSDVIVGNQCLYNSIDSFEYRGHSAVYLNFNERGVGLNRNNALMRATADYCLFADDDLVYIDGYPEYVNNAFDENKDADVIIFNVNGRQCNKKKTKVNKLNFLRYGTVRIGVKLKSIRENAIFFNQCFGGGSEYRHGEDNLFLSECLKKGLKIIAVPTTIASLSADRESSWNVGYDDKYYEDQGSLYKHISKKFWKVLCLQDAIRHSNIYQNSWHNVYKKMTK